MEIAGEVQIDVLHRDHLRVAAACCAAFDAKHRTERRLANRDHTVLPDAAQAIGQTDGDGGFAFACGRGIDGGDEYQFAFALCVGQLADFGLVVAVAFDVCFAQSDLRRDVANVSAADAAGDFNICFHCYCP